jgi:SHS2 domain-containing protein
VAARGTYEIIEHTADAGVAASGATKAEAFANMALGVYSLLTDPNLVEEREHREITIEAPDDARLLERWLIELLFLTETERLVFRRFDVTIAGMKLHATAYGEALDRARHELKGDIKGVTRHMTAVERVDDGYRARVLVDM